MVKYRASLYNIYVDLVEKKGYALIMHGFTGEYMQVPKGLVVFFKKHQYFNIDRNSLKHIEDEYLLSDNDRKSLKVKGFITRKSEKAEQEFFKKLVLNRHKRFKRRPVEYVFLLSYNCNFNCDYCFQNFMKERLGPDKIKKQITQELVDNIIRLIPAFEKEKNTYRPAETPMEVVFYGGEPLLTKNKNIVEYIITEFKKLGKTKFCAISNGFDLEHYADLLGENKISNIQITLDGFENIHNKRRNVGNQDKNSFQIICNNISMALDKNVNINLRVNIDRTNIESLPLLMEEIELRDWISNKFFSISVAPIYLPHNNKNFKNTYTISSLYDEIVDKRNKNKNYLKLKFDEERCLEKMSIRFNEQLNVSYFFHTTYCSGPTNMLVFDPFSNVYGCLEKGADPNVAIGTIKNNGIFINNKKYQDHWESRVVSSNKKCVKCCYALFCGGGCPTKAEEKNGTIFSNYCNGFKAFFNKKVADVYENSEKYIEGNKYV